MKRLFIPITVILVLASAFALGACVAPAPQAPAAPAAEEAAPPQEEAPAAAEAPSAEAPVTIQVYYPVAVDAPIADILNGYVADFQAEHPNITVEPVFSGGYGDVKTAIQTAVDGGAAPPALAVMLATDLYDLVNADLIVPLDDYIAAMPDGEAYLSDFFPAFLANSRYDGKIWSLPFQRSAVVLYYNADLFKEAGLEPPDSWEALANAAQALTVREGDEVKRWGIEWPSGWPYWLFQPLAIGAGQNIVGESDTEVIFDHPAVIEAVQFYIDLSKKYGAMPEGVQAVWGQAPSDFASGQTAMIVHSSGSLAGILKQADFEVGVMPIPGKEPGTYASVPGGGNLYIFKGAPKEQQDAAWQFIEFLTAPERAADFSIQTGYIATRVSAYETEAMQQYLAEVPQAASTRDALQYAGAELSVQNLGEVRNIFHDYLQKAYNGEMSPAEAMAAAQQAADEALADFR
ncbi:MAG: ABC transporter substrate-binding protein [Chloroflexi bacterium]|nr:MAG: ABC transporter substrate-binding protein [Chloroflexota bacterium]